MQSSDNCYNWKRSVWFSGGQEWYADFVGHDAECTDNDDCIKHVTVTEAEANRRLGRLRRKWWNGVEEDMTRFGLTRQDAQVWYERRN